jgi:hypothetical protein
VVVKVEVEVEVKVVVVVVEMVDMVVYYQHHIRYQFITNLPQVHLPHHLLSQGPLLHPICLVNIDQPNDNLRVMLT